MKRALDKDGITKSEAVRRFKRLPVFRNPRPGVRRAAWESHLRELHSDGLITTEQRDGWTYPWGQTRHNV